MSTNLSTQGYVLATLYYNILILKKLRNCAYQVFYLKIHRKKILAILKVDITHEIQNFLSNILSSNKSVGALNWKIITFIS